MGSRSAPGSDCMIGSMLGLGFGIGAWTTAGFGFGILTGLAAGFGFGLAIGVAFIFALVSRAGRVKNHQGFQQDTIRDRKA